MHLVPPARPGVGGGVSSSRASIFATIDLPLDEDYDVCLWMLVLVLLFVIRIVLHMYPGILS